MSLFILPENQKVIWDIINKAPQFAEFGKNTNESKEDWFRETIKQIYDKHKDKSMNVQELRQLNKDTISMMINSLKIKTNINVNNNINTTPILDLPKLNELSPNEYMNEDKTSTRNYMLEQKHDLLNSQFASKQQEFDGLMLRKPVNEINFSEQDCTDQPIDNMDELLQKHISEREYDVNSPPKSNITGIDIDNKSIFQNDDQTNVSKNVKWAPNLDNTNNNSNTYISMEVFQNFVRNTNNELQNLRNEINEMKKERKTESSIPSLLSRMKKNKNNNSTTNQIEDISNYVRY